MLMMQLAYDSSLAIDAEFEESKHPRDKSGEFKSGGSTETGSAAANALSPTDKSYIVNSHVGLLIKAAGYKKAKTDDGLLTFQHESGAKVVIHPPESGKKSSSKWTHMAEKGGQLTPGEGVAIAKMLGVAVQKAEGGKVKPVVPGSEEASKLKKSVTDFAKGFGFYYLYGSPNDSVATYTNGSGLKLKVNNNGAWSLTGPSMPSPEYGTGVNELAIAKGLKSGGEPAPSVPTPAPTAPSVPAPAPKPTSTSYSSTLKEKNYTLAKKLSSNPDVYEWKKENGAKVEYNTDTDEWLALTPGFPTKEGKSSNNLTKLLAGGKVEKDAAGNHTWENSTKTSLVEPPKPVETEAQKAAKAKALAEKSAYIAANAKAAEELKGKKASMGKALQTLIDAAPQPTSAQKTGIKSYTDGGYHKMNDALRAGGQLDGSAKALNDYLMGAKFPEDVELHRKIGGSYAKIVKSFLDIGAKFFDKGFTSASPFNDVWSGEVELVIAVKKGQSGAAVAHMSASGFGEKEVMLPANSAFVVTAYDPASHIVHVELDQSHYNKK